MLGILNKLGLLALVLAVAASLGSAASAKSDWNTSPQAGLNKAIKTAANAQQSQTAKLNAAKVKTRHVSAFCCPRIRIPPVVIAAATNPFPGPTRCLPCGMPGHAISAEDPGGVCSEHGGEYDSHVIDTYQDPVYGYTEVVEYLCNDGEVIHVHQHYGVEGEPRPPLPVLIYGPNDPGDGGDSGSGQDSSPPPEPGPVPGCDPGDWQPGC